MDTQFKSVMENYLNEIQAAADYVRKQDTRKPTAAVILGSGLGNLGEQIENPTVIPYSTIPGFQISTAVGHKGNLIIGELGGKTVLAMQGRFHYYEGYSMLQVTFPVRVMAALGIKYLFVSNAAGGLNTAFEVGDIMLISDHINMAPNPLIGPHVPQWGERFPDMGDAYSPRLQKLAEQKAAQLGISLRKGIYVIVTGPTYETPAECRCYARMGADAIGMSTVPEVIVARQAGIEVMGASVITDPAHFDRKEGYTISADEVIVAANAAAERLCKLFKAVIAEIA